jgi:hypothetical protein
MCRQSPVLVYIGRLGCIYMGTEGAGLQDFLPVVWVYDRWLLHTTVYCRLIGFQQLFFKGGIGYAGKFSITSPQGNELIRGFVE